MSDPNKFEKELSKYNFPEELNIKVVSATIEFSLPINLPANVKDSLWEQDFKKNDPAMICSQKQKVSRRYILKGGQFETKIRSLIFILNNVLKDGQPVFKCEYIPQSVYPLPNNRFHFLNKDIPVNLANDQIDSFKSSLSLDISNKTQSSLLSKDAFKSSQKQAKLTTEEVYLLLSVFNPEQCNNIIGLKQDENHDPQIFQLNIPIAISVLIQYIKFDEYQIKFANNGQFKAEKIYEQIIERALPNIKSLDCIIATFSKTDPLDYSKIVEGINDSDSVIAFIPDESTTDEDFATTFVEIFLPNLDDSSFQHTKEVLEKCYEDVKLAVCKKCKFFYCPAQDETCYELYHTGKQIPFESGQMEEIDEDEEEEPIVLVNYSCCGECIKGEPPMNCGKRENGKHEQDPKEGIISKFEIKRGHPGDVKLSH